MASGTNRSRPAGKAFNGEGMSPASGGYYGLGHFGEQSYLGRQQRPDAIDHFPDDRCMSRHAISRPMYTAPQTSGDQVAYVVPDGRGRLACTLLGSNPACKSRCDDVVVEASRRRTQRRRCRRRQQKHATIAKQNQLPLVSGTIRRGTTLSLVSLLSGIIRMPYLSLQKIKLLAEAHYRRASGRRSIMDEAPMQFSRWKTRRQKQCSMILSSS